MTAEIESLTETQADIASQHSLALVRQSLEQATQLTRSLLVYARREPVFPMCIEPDALIREMVPLLSALARGDVAIRTFLCAPGAQIMVDQAQLRQLVMNLVGNAVEATRGHGSAVTVSTAVEFLDEMLARSHGAARGGRFVVITVADDGRGMDRHTLAHALEPFFTTKDSGKGTGLGLSICQAIVQRAEGFLSIDSTLGRGTVCRAFLPLAAPKAARELEPEEPAPNNEGHLFTNALVVDDDPLIRELMLVALEPIAQHVQAAAGAEAAAQIAASEDVDLMVTDGNLADGSGRVLARSLRAARPSLRVLLVSGAFEEGPEFDAILTKPFTLDALRKAAASLARGHNHHRP